MKKILRSKILWALIGIFLILVLVIPPLVVPTINKFLADFSPLFKAHIEGIGVHPLKGAYSVKGLEVSLKDKSEENFLSTDYIEASIAWRELIKGRISADVLISGSHTLLTDNVLNAVKKVKKQAKEDSKKAIKKVIPIRIERIDIRDSSFEIADFRKLPPEERWRLTDIKGHVTNATPSESNPFSLVALTGTLLDSAKLNISAHINSMKDPMIWDVDLELENFELKKANPVLRSKLPLTFTRGQFDLYAEMKSEKGSLQGYAKPFFHKVDVVARGEDFEGLKHYGIEASTAAINLFLRNAKDRTMATKIQFTYEDGKFDINSGKALSEAIENSFGDEVPKGIEDSVSLASAGDKPSAKP